jgi:hypothetical protein
MNENIKEKRIRRKYSDSGIKGKFLAKKADGTFMEHADSIKGIVSIIRDCGIQNDIKNVFYKDRTREFFIVSNTSIYGLEDLDPSFKERFKKEWSTTFLSFTIGIYTAYLDQYRDITEEINILVEDEAFENIEYWRMNMTTRE